jgi:hypothetical protein
MKAKQFLTIAACAAMTFLAVNANAQSNDISANSNVKQASLISAISKYSNPEKRQSLAIGSNEDKEPFSYEDAAQVLSKVKTKDEVLNAVFGVRESFSYENDYNNKDYNSNETKKFSYK